MPGTTKRLHLILAEYEDDDDVGEFEVPVKQDEFDESSPELGLQYFLLATPSNNLRAEAGLRLNGFDPNPYVGVRYRHTEVFEPWALRFRQRFRSYVEEGFESRSIIDFERLVSERLFFRSTTNASWFEEDNAWFYGQTFSLFHQVSELSLLTYEWRSEFTSEPELVLTETRLRVGLNRRIFRDWIGLEISPQVAWRDDVDYKPVLGLFVALDFLFGAARRL
jgi:hypothetical protein